MNGEGLCVPSEGLSALLGAIVHVKQENDLVRPVLFKLEKLSAGSLLARSLRRWLSERKAF